MCLKFHDDIPNKSFTLDPTKKYKGHTKITLTDVNTGEVKVHEEDNYVTDAISNIFTDNYSLTLDLSQLLPTYKLFGGVFCFQNQIVGDETTVSPPNEDDNHLIAHAGDEPHATASTLRGNPNGGETVIGSNSVKFVWDWSTNQGNGTINCVCLTSALGGNGGLKPFDDTYFSSLNSVSLPSIRYTTGSGYNQEEAIKHPLIYVDETTGISLYYTSTTLQELTVKHDYLKFGLTRAPSSFVLQSSRSVNLSDISLVEPAPITQYSAIFIDPDYYCIVTPVSTGSLNITKISRETMSATSGTFSYAVDFMTDFSMSGLAKFALLPSEPGYFYWPNLTNTGFYRISISNPTDIVSITGNISNLVRADQLVTEWQGRARCMHVVGTHLIVGPSYIINGTHIYPSKGMDLSTGTTSDTYPPYVYTYGRGNNSRFQVTLAPMSARVNYSGACFNALYLATINNLAQPVTKSNNQMMKIEYTLTEVS